MASSTCDSPRPPRAALPALLVVLIAARAARAADGPAPVADADVRRAATAKLVEGVALLKEAQYAAALARFDEAYALFPSPNIHYDRGLAYVGLGRPAAAMEAFDAFLAGASQPPPGKRELAQRHRDELRGRVARLDLDSDPRGAEVSVDGRSYGPTPLAHAIHLDPGPHELRARLPGGASAVERVDAAAGRELKMTLKLAIAAPGAPVVIQPPPVAAAPAVPIARAAARDGEARSSARVWTVAAAGVGVALLGAGVTFGLLARHYGDALTDDSRRGATNPPVVFDSSKQDSGLGYQTWEIVCLGVGGAVLAGSAVAFVLERPHTAQAEAGRSAAPRRAAWSLAGAPVVAPTLAGARVQVWF